MLRILKITLFILFAVGVLGLMGFIFFENGNQELNEVIVRIDRETENGFLDEVRLMSLVEKTDSVSNKMIKEISTKRIENIISQNVFVRNTDVYINLDNNLIINVREKVPVLRIFPRRDNGFYIDQNGQMFPLSENYTSRVIIANGYLNYSFDNDHVSIYDAVYKKNTLRDIFELTNIINANDFLTAQISQIYVNSIGEYDLIPGLGDHIIQLGTIENASEKLTNLEYWYKKAMLQEEWNKYKIINIKYKDQVVCTQK